jgi:tRNA(Ile)-lysidine synthetase-like protein
MIELLVDAKLDQGVMLEQGLKVCRLESMPLLQAQGDPGQESFARGSKPQEILLSGDSSQALFDGCQITWSRQPIVGQVNPVSSSPFSECFDADVLGEQVWLRHWQAGDRMTLIGSHGSSKLQDVFTNLKWSALQRHQALVAHDRRGRIFWVEGLRIADFAKMTPATRHVLTWTWNRSLA